MPHLHLSSLFAPVLFSVGWVLLLLLGASGRRWRLIFLAPWSFGLCVLTLATTGIQARMALSPETMRQDRGHAFVADIGRGYGPFIIPSDGDEKFAQRSVLKVQEEGRRLLPGHASREAIEKIGGGAFSHWNGKLYFSSSDGTDPTVNGRQYRIRFKMFLDPVIAAGAAILGFVASGLLIWRLPRPAGGSAPVRVHNESLWSVPVERKRVTWYLVIGLLVSCGGAAIYSVATFPRYDAASGGDNTLPSRVKYYLANRDNFDLIFLGDSRTYCGIHPLLIDGIVGVRSYSLANFANWLPTQYALVTDLAPKIPKSTTVVLSIGTQNFSQGNLTVQRVYPIDISVGFREWFWGLRQKGLWDNIFFYNRFMHFLAVRSELRSEIGAAMNLPVDSPTIFPAAHASEVAVPEPTAVPALQRNLDGAEAEATLRRVYGNLPGVSSIQINRDNGKIISVVLYLHDGTYYRVEIDRAFFRQKQAEMFPFDAGARSGGTPPEVDPAMLRIFEAILDELKAQGLRVIVNIVEETPRALNAAARQQAREMMQRVIRPAVEKRGFQYMRIDWDKFTDADYFDYNHLNSLGSKKAADLIGNQLKTLLSH